jgi:hypothetical protein
MEIRFSGVSCKNSTPLRVIGKHLKSRLHSHKRDDAGPFGLKDLPYTVRILFINDRLEGRARLRDLAWHRLPTWHCDREQTQQARATRGGGAGVPDRLRIPAALEEWPVSPGAGRRPTT